MKKLFKRSVWTLLAVFFAIFFAIVLVAGQIASDYAYWIDTFFDVNRYELVEDGNAEDKDTQYFKSDFAVKDENGNLVLKETSGGLKKQTYDTEAMRKKSLEVSEAVVEEGNVLLWNNNHALPLAEGSKITNFGVGSYSWFYGGVGSGKVTIDDIDVKATYEAHGFVVNADMFKAFESANRLGFNVGLRQCSEMPWATYGQYASRGLKNIEQYGDAAIYTLSRHTGEGFDMNTQNEGVHALAITESEYSVFAGLKQLKQEGKIKKIILLINSANPMPLGNLKDYDIDACIWAGWGGNRSLDGTLDLVLGRTNPSGRLTDTWVYDFFSAPSNQNFGDFAFTNSADLPDTNNGKQDRYVVYQEGIYVGYRYYETRYEDTVLGKGNAKAGTGVTSGKANWSYQDEVAYTFGSGESYTTFEYSNFSVRRVGSDWQVTMTITNTGNVAGKEVMQVYLQKPYTQYDIDNKIEKAAVELVGFDKTEVLQPNASATLTVTVPEYEFKTYDSYGKGTYILEGDRDLKFYLAAGKNSHDALNNILAAKGYSKTDGMDADGNRNFAYAIDTYKEIDSETYSVRNGYKIVNQFNDTDINLYEGTKDQKINYLSRNDWEKTYPYSVTLTASQTMIDALQFDGEVPVDPEATMPDYEKVTSPYGKLTLIQLKGLPYNDPLWEHLLNQMTFAEEVNFIRNIGSGATSVNAPEAPGRDGPCGLIQTNLQLPCNPLVASTFNQTLVADMGRTCGEEMMNKNIVGIYGVGANTHRSSFGGRAWEYYSEDGFLSGEINSAVSKGMREKGVILYTKHFALNDQETNRDGVTTWANEQSIREIYLKAFETAITDGNCNGLMTAFNRFGCTWSGMHTGLLTNVLRNEWGFIGVTITDAGGTMDYMGASHHTIHARGVIAGQDSWMGNIPSNTFDTYKNNATVCRAIRESVHRFLYTYLDTYAMNGFSSTTRVNEITPAWENAILTAQVITGILTAACLGMVAASWVLWYRNDREIAEI